MRDIRKKIVTDEHGEPLAVQIDYADWLEIERQLKASQEREVLPEENTFERALEETKGRDEHSLSELAEAARPYWKGGDGLEYQRRLREEWTRPWDPEASSSQ